MPRIVAAAGAVVVAAALRFGLLAATHYQAAATAPDAHPLAQGDSTSVALVPALHACPTPPIHYL